MKYLVEVVKVGSMVKELLSENMMIIFNENVPEELAEISVVHTISKLKENIIVGDRIKIGDLKYEVVAVGKEANKTLKELGHCTFKFKDSDIPDLPGVINLKGDKEPVKVKVGDIIYIY